MSFISVTTKRLMKEGRINSEAYSIVEAEPPPWATQVGYALLDNKDSDIEPIMFQDPFLAVARWDLLNNLYMRSFHSTSPSYTKVIK